MLPTTRAKLLRALSSETDLARRLELCPPSAKIRGLYLTSIERVVDAAGRREHYRALFPERFTAIRWYAYSDLLLRLVAAGALLAGPERAHDGMFEIGRQNAVAFANSLVGKILVGFLERDPKKLLLQGMAGRRQSTTYGRWDLTFPGEREAVVTMIDEYAFIESYMLGAAQGTFDAVGVPVKIEVALQDPFNGQHILRW